MDSDILNIANAYGYNVDRLQSLLEGICGRRKQIEMLLKLFGPPLSLAYESIFIYGGSGTAKSLVLSSLMEQLQLHHAWVNCVEAYSPYYLFESVLHSLKYAGEQDNTNSNYSCQSENMCDFLYKLKSVIENRQETTYIVLDNAELLRRLNYSITSTFLRLQELTGMNICVILISAVEWQKFYQNTAIGDPFVLHFPEYNKNELLSILSLHCPPEVHKNFYITYLNIILRTFLLATRNVKELQYLASLNFAKYMEPIRSGEANEDDLHKLWKNIEPHLKAALSTVYLREIAGYQFEEKSQHKAVEPSKPVTSRKSTELPFYSKFLLLACYIASYNPPSTDGKFFLKSRSKILKKRPKKKKRLNTHLLGPKAFSLDRMMAIFYSIIEENVPLTAMLFSQIASLISLRLVARASRVEDIVAPKYRCLVSLDVIKSIARTVNFDIMHYLDDFT